MNLDSSFLISKTNYAKKAICIPIMHFEFEKVAFYGVAGKSDSYY